LYLRWFGGHPVYQRQRPVYVPDVKCLLAESLQLKLFAPIPVHSRRLCHSFVRAILSIESRRKTSSKLPRLVPWVDSNGYVAKDAATSLRAILNTSRELQES
jgi:hypothetical protein